MEDIHLFIYNKWNIIKYYSTWKKEENPVICDTINDLGGHYTQWNNFLVFLVKTELLAKSGSTMVIVRSGRWGKQEKFGRRVQTSGYKMNKVYVANV